MTIPAGTAAIVVVAGVSGSGKSTLGCQVAARLGVAFQEGDDLHPAANIAKMAAGQPLDDADRRPWLDAVAAWIEHATEGGGGVISCSALKRRYRTQLRDAAPGRVAIVLLAPPVAVLRARLAARTSHFMPPALLDSQLATLEAPGADEQVLVLTGDDGTDADCTAVLGWLGERQPNATPTVMASPKRGEVA